MKKRCSSAVTMWHAICTQVHFFFHLLDHVRTGMRTLQGCREGVAILDRHVCKAAWQGQFQRPALFSQLELGIAEKNKLLPEKCSGISCAYLSQTRQRAK